MSLLCVVPPQKYILHGSDFGFTIALYQGFPVGAVSPPLGALWSSRGAVKQKRAVGGR